MIVSLNDDQVVLVTEALKFYKDWMDELGDSEGKWHYNHFITKPGLVEHLEKYTKEYNYPGTEL